MYRESPVELTPSAHLLSSLKQSISVLSTSGTVISVTGSIEQVLGYSPAERVGHRAMELLHPNDQARAIESFVSIVSGEFAEQTLTVRGQHRDGTTVPLEITLCGALDDPLVNGVLMSVRAVPVIRGQDPELDAWSDPEVRRLLGDALALIRADAQPDTPKPVDYHADLTASLERILHATGANAVTVAVRGHEASGLSIVRRQDRSGRLPGSGPFHFTGHIEPAWLDLQETVVLRADQKPVQAGPLLRALAGCPSAHDLAVLPVSVGSRQGIMVLTADENHDFRVAKYLRKEIATLIEPAVTTWLHRSEIFQKEKDRFARLLEQSVDLVAVVNRSYRLTYASPSVVRLLGLDDSRLMPRLDAYFPPDALDPFFDVVKPGVPVTTDFTLMIDGVEHTLRGTFTNLFDDSLIGGWLINAVDITDRVCEEHERVDAAARRTAIAEAVSRLAETSSSTIQEDLRLPLDAFRSFVGADRVVLWQRADGGRTFSVTHEIAADGVALLGPALTAINHAALQNEMSGGSELIRGSDELFPILFPFVQVDDAPAVSDAMMLPLRIGRELHGLLLAVRFSGRFHEEVHGTARSFTSNIANAIGRCAAITTLERQAVTDALTSLGNRRALDLALRKLAKRQTPAKGVATLFCDVDDFKFINDSMGHDSGDYVLTALADRMRALCRDEDVVVRLGGDEFVIVVDRVESREEAELIASRLLAHLIEPLEVSGRVLRPSVCLGVSWTSGEEISRYGAGRLISHADLALIQAKARGRGEIEVFDDQMGVDATARLAMLNDLRYAIERKEITVHVQPIVDACETRDVLSLECLARWTRNGSESIPPDIFVELAERSGLINDLSRHVLTTGLELIAGWRSRGVVKESTSISVNLSGRDLRSSLITEHIAAELGRLQLPARVLRVELTESSSIEADVVLHHLMSLRELGVQVSIDDFGTGYASLSYLRDLPASAVKIDRSFVQDIHDHRSHALIAATIAMSHALQMHVVAEGVETTEQLEALRNLGCDQVQGYLIARPLSPEALEDWLLANRAAVSTASPNGY